MKTEDSDYYIYNVCIDQDKTSFVVKSVSGEVQKFSTSLLGEHNLYNILSAISCANTIGMSLEEISHRVSELKPITHRLELKRFDERTIIIDDAYNSNPDSLGSALESFFESDRLIKSVILGDMLELGDYSIEEHIKIVEKLSERADLNVVLVGPVFSEVASNLGFSLFPDTEQLIDYLRSNPILNSYILIKGSRGIGLERIYSYL